MVREVSSRTFSFPGAYHTLKPSEGGIVLSSTGSIQVNAYSSFARLPLQDVAISIAAPDGTALALALTDRSGRIDPVTLPVPDPSASQAPNTGQAGFATVDLRARLRGYEQIDIRGLQVFPGITTVQDLEMIPLSELPSQWGKTETFDTPPQNL